MSALKNIIQQLNTARQPGGSYYIPGLWADGVSTDAVSVNPYDFYQTRLAAILRANQQPLVQGNGSGEWTRHATIYNLFPRLTTAFDHDDDGAIQPGPNKDGWRETGSLLKCIALLPFLRMMGFNTVHLLPITSIGQDGKKGNLGSPYAIRNPYQLDSNLNEPALGLSSEALFAGFVEAAHHLGMRVVMEFVLRTAAKDSDWICQHPDWFYWIRADVPDRTGHTGRSGMLRTFGQPVFSQDELNLLHWKIGQGDFHDLPQPPESYRALYTAAPQPNKITTEGGRFIGHLDDGTAVRIPGAFPDFPPNDTQPPWSDVTYLRLHTHPDFNYMAYNTLRMYDHRLSDGAYVNRPLWDAVTGVIPHYQQQFGIDGVLIDMGHALPMPLKEKMVRAAREINPDFAFWDESFSVDQRARDEGYNAVVGYWLLGLHEANSLRGFLGQMASHPYPISFLAAPENHNTPRAFSRFGGVAYAHYALALSVLTPGVPFILTGFELGETQPINTGIGFSYEQISQYPPERLPLFSVWSLDWTRPNNYVQSIKQALYIRAKYAHVIEDANPATFQVGSSNNGQIIALTRHKGHDRVTLIANADMAHQQGGRVTLTATGLRAPGLWGIPAGDMEVYQELTANVNLSPGYSIILETGKARRP
jgi:starch synthase (maltosyl-transferring)